MSLKTKASAHMKSAVAAVNKVLSTLDVTKKVDKSLVLCAAEAVVAAEVVVNEWLAEATKRSTEEMTADTKEDDILATEAKTKVAYLRKLCAGMATVVTMEVVMTNRMTKRRRHWQCFVSALVLTSIVTYCMM